AVTASWILRRGFANATALMGFVRNIDPQLCLAARTAGLLTVGDQMIAPAIVELREAQLQAERFPGWEQTPLTSDLIAIDAYERRTWAQLDHVTCPSDYVREGLLAQGLSPQKVTTIPYAVDETTFTMPDRRDRGGPMLVGFVGSVNLRK
ncbi:MAG TPA: glycosyltransferase, partial [Tepidisphaeraceae bacterium]|nr:glycosyltransferase [Tepidisphaeraceae bacterium]